MDLTTFIKEYGTDEKIHDIGNGFKLITRKAININQGFIEYALYKDNDRVLNPYMLDEDVFPDETNSKFEKVLMDEKTKSMFVRVMEIEEGNLERQDKLIPKNVWYAIGDTYSKKDSLKASGMQWESVLKAWASIEKPFVEGVEFIKMKTYKSANAWTYYYA